MAWKNVKQNISNKLSEKIQKLGSKQKERKCVGEKVSPTKYN